MYIKQTLMYIDGRMGEQEKPPMPPTRNLSHKHFRLDAAKIKRAQKALRAKTETETVERALDLVISESRTRQLTRDATRQFLTSGIQIKDVYGNLDN
jgi:Arc/MetJ family transcription regulator